MKYAKKYEICKKNLLCPQLLISVVMENNGSCRKSKAIYCLLEFCLASFQELLLPNQHHQNSQKKTINLQKMKENTV